MENYIEELSMAYFDKFGELPPNLPMMISQDSEWFVSLLEFALGMDEPIKQSDVNDYIEKNDIIHDLAEEKEDGDKD